MEKLLSKLNYLFIIVKTNEFNVVLPCEIIRLSKSRIKNDSDEIKEMKT